MKSTALNTILFLAIVALIAGCGPRGNLTVVEKRQVITDMEKETLERLYKESPGTKDKIEKAAGYGTFSNANVNLIFASAGSGYGSGGDNSTGKRTYMKMGVGGGGLGFGGKDLWVG